MIVLSEELRNKIKGAKLFLFFEYYECGSHYYESDGGFNCIRPNLENIERESPEIPENNIFGPSKQNEKGIVEIDLALAAYVVYNLEEVNK